MLKKSAAVILTVVMFLSLLCASPAASAETEPEANPVVIDRTYLTAGDSLRVQHPENTGLTVCVGEQEFAGEDFVLTSDYYEQWITVKAYDGDTLVGEDSVYFSKLPVLYINTDDGEPITSKEEYKSGDLYIQNNTAVGSAVYDGALSIKGRGNSTWNWAKKPYRIKLDKKTDLFGMGKNKNWVLLANYLDESLLRNTTAFRLSEELGLVTMSTVWTDVVLNGEYAGNYQLCEQIRVDAGRIEVFDWEEEAKSLASAVSKAEKKKGNAIDKDALEDCLTQNMAWITGTEFTFGGKTYTVSDYYDVADDLSGGYLFELSNEYDEFSKFQTKSGLKVMVKSPEYLASNSDMLQYVRQVWQQFEDAYRAGNGYVQTVDGDSHYSQFADLDSMVAYWLMLEIMGNNDAYYKSRYAYQDVGGLIKFGPAWDFDWGCGSLTVGTSATGWKLTHKDSPQNFFKDLVDDPLFIVKATEMYRDVRPFLEDLIRSDGVITNDIEYLRESGLADQARWDRKDNWPNAARGFLNDANKFLTYLRSRVKWLDQQFATEDALLGSLYTELSAAPYTRDSDKLAISLLNAADDTALSAPADGCVGIGRGAAVRIAVNAGNTASIDVYVNGLYAETISASGEPFVMIGSDLLYEQAGSKNVISLIGRSASGETTCRNFASVIREEVAKVMLGDADGNGDITIIDATMIQRWLAGLDVPQFSYDGANLSGEGVSILDATAIQRYLASFAVEFPIGDEI